MQTVTDIDREAAAALREAIAELSGFWIRPGDDDVLCQTLARHRAEAEARVVAKLTPFIGKALLRSARGMPYRAPPIAPASCPDRAIPPRRR